MTYLDRAIKDGYAIITGPENKQKIIYVTSDNHTENYNDPEEKVRAEFWAELIYEYDYPAHRIKVEVTIPDRVPTDRADIVIFSDDECKKPYAVVECKRDGVTDAEFLQAIEQGVGNATWVKLRASYVVIIAGATRRVLDFSDDSTGILERENNIIADLPKAYGKPQAFRFYRGGEYTDVDGKKKKAPDIQPVAREDLITAIKKCHNTLWGGGRLSPPTAFGELCKLIFVKISDEQKPRKKGEPYQFQIKTHEPSSKLAERINALYNEQKVKDPEVFTDSIKDAKGKYKDRPRQSSEILFIERIWEFLKPGTGKAAIVLPDGVLTNSSAQYVRDFILEKFQLLAVVSLPQCAFAHFGAGVKASIIFVRKRKADEKPDENEAIFMAAPALIGYDATGRKTNSQLDEIIQKYEEFQKDATSFFA